MRKRLTAHMVLMVALILGTVSGSSGQQGKCPMTKEGHHMGMGMGGGTMMFKELNLSGRQQEQVKAVMDRHQNEMQGLDQKIDAARKSVHEAVHTDTFNEQMIRDAHKTLALEMESMAVLRGKIFSEIRPILTPEQLKQWKEMRNRHMEKMGDPSKCPATME